MICTTYFLTFFSELIPPTGNKYDHPTTVYGNIVLDNSHAVMHATPWVANYLSCTYENVKGSGNGCLEITLPDSIHGLVHFRKWDGSQFIPLDSARIVNRKCTFYYNTSEITDERVSFYVEQPYSTIIPENIQTGSTWNYLLKNNTLIKANANPKTIFNNFIATLSGSPETYVQMQLMSKTSGYKDLQGYISKAFIQKHSDSKLLLRELFYSGSSYASVNDLKEAFSLFNENTRQSSKGKELASYIKEREEYDKHGVSRKFVYFDATGKQYNLNDCMNGKQLCVVVFWASWCGPCLEEIPRLKEFYKEYKDQVSLVSLSLDDNYTKWTDRMKQYPVEWLNLSGLPKDKKKVINDFGITTIPNFMILDSKGKIIASQYIRKGNEMRPLELEDIKEIINQKIQR